MKYSPWRSHVLFNSRLCSVRPWLAAEIAPEIQTSTRSQFSPNDSDKAVIMDNFRETRYAGPRRKTSIFGNEPKMIIRVLRGVGDIRPFYFDENRNWREEDIRVINIGIFKLEFNAVRCLQYVVNLVSGVKVKFAIGNCVLK